MNRREQATAMRQTWMVMREPKDIDGNRRTRRARVVQARRDARAYAKTREAFEARERALCEQIGNIDPGNPYGRAVSASAVEEPVSAGGQEPQADRASPSTADSEIGRCVVTGISGSGRGTVTLGEPPHDEPRTFEQWDFREELGGMPVDE